MLNHIVLMGRLTKDPELRRTGSGIPVTSFTLAVDRDFKSDGGETVDFVDIVAWRNTAEFVAKYFSNGRMAVVSGRLEIRNWTDKNGNKRRNAEVLAENVYFGDSKKDADGAQNYGVTNIGAIEDRPVMNYSQEVVGQLSDYFPKTEYTVIEGDDDELPF